MKAARRVLAAMSGGVDSAVSAFLLKEQGYEVIGANMRFWAYPEADACETPASGRKRITSCCSPEDLGDAERTARALGIPFYALKMEKDFRASVIDPFIQDYKEARTPNPCVHCNTFIKFGEFYEKAWAMGFDYIATGHYADVRQSPSGRWSIFPAADARKDQSYYLYGLSQKALQHTIFPLAGLNKSRVREIAEENGIPVAQKPDSQEICFIPGNDYREFLRQEGVQFTPGFIRNRQGNILAKHDGRENFTIGQRKGLPGGSAEAVYVLEILENGDVVVGTREEMNDTVFEVLDPVFQGWQPDADSDGTEIRALARIRYNSRPEPAVLRKENGKWICRMEKPAWAVTPGQAAVFYDPEQQFIQAGGKIRKLAAVPAAG